MKIVTFKTIIYGEYKCSCGCGNVLGNDSALNVQWFNVIANAEDEEGVAWRIFSPECYKKLAGMDAEEIYNKYCAAQRIEE